MTRIATRTLLAVCFYWPLMAGSLEGQVSSRRGPPMPVDSATASLLYTLMAADLRNLVVSQERYYADHGRYGTTLGATGDTSRVQIVPSPGVTVTLSYATRNSWIARAVHDWLGGRSCVVSIGAIPPSRAIRTSRDGKAPTEEGVPVCDSP